MDDSLIQSFSSIYAKTDVPIMLTDSDFKIIWKNDNSVLSKLDENDLSMYISNPHPYDNNFSVNVNLQGLGVVLNATKIGDEGTTTGFIIRAVTAGEVFNMVSKREFLYQQMELCSDIRAFVSGLLSTITLMHSIIERHEMYEEVALLNKQINYCYKILASLANPVELSKYSYNLFNISRINLRTFISEIVAYISSILRNKDISVSFSCNEDVYIKTDPERFMVMLLNLIINAIQYNISEQKTVDISLKKSGNHAILTVRDNGLGLIEEKIKPYFSSDFIHDILWNENYAINHVVGHGLVILGFYCKTFGCTRYFSGKENEGTTVSLKMDICESDDFPTYANARTVDYMTNRFSSLYVLLSKVCEIKYIP